ncbi:unnamed protein product, partial [Wuchereria bancrofti]
PSQTLPREELKLQYEINSRAVKEKITHLEYYVELIETVIKNGLTIATKRKEEEAKYASMVDDSKGETSALTTINSPKGDNQIKKIQWVENGEDYAYFAIRITGIMNVTFIPHSNSEWNIWGKSLRVSNVYEQDIRQVIAKNGNFCVSIVKVHTIQ